MKKTTATIITVSKTELRKLYGNVYLEVRFLGYLYLF